MTSKRVKNLKELGKIQLLMESTIAFANLLIVSGVVERDFFQKLMKEGKVREATRYTINLTNHFLREQQRLAKDATGLVDPSGNPVRSQ